MGENHENREEERLDLSLEQGNDEEYQQGLSSGNEKAAGGLKDPVSGHEKEGDPVHEDGSGHESGHAHTYHTHTDEAHTHHSRHQEHSHSYGHAHSHGHHHRHRHRKPESPLAAGRRKKARAAVFAVSAAAVVLTLWLAVRNTEGLLAQRQAGETPPGREEETELVIPREVKGEVKLGKTWYTYDHAIESWLLIGTDGNWSGEGEEYHGAMADFAALAVFDKTDKTYALLQLDRNTVMEVWMMNPDGSRNASAQMPLCTAHWYGGTPQQGCENTVYAVSRFLGRLKIDGYYCLNMEDIGTLNRLVGGVEVTVEGDFSEEDPSLKEGETVVLTDEQAVSYVRGRMSVGDGSNAGRMRRQRQYLEGFLLKVKERTKESGSFVNELYRQLESLAVTTMTDRDLSRLAKRVDQGRSLGIYTLEGEHTEELSQADGEYHERFYADEESVLSVMTELYHLKEKEAT